MTVADDSGAPDDHVSITASETSSEGSYMSQPPPLLDFINATCMATARLASCFPCAVVDINDSDDYVVDRLSRENAMNVMYGSSSVNNNATTATTPTSTNSPPNTFVSENDSRKALVDGIRFSNNGLGEYKDDDDMLFIQLSNSEHTPQNDMPIQSNPSAIVEEDRSHHDDVDLHTISLNDGATGSSVVPDECVTDNSSTAMRNREPQDSEIVSENEIPIIYSPPKDPSKKKKKFGMKLFGRKKKA